MWASVKEILSKIKNEKYVFLRNSKEISDDFTENDDWDILCEDLEKIIMICDAKPIGNSTYNYYTYINNKKLLLDIRTPGDGYFDENWEKHILEKRVLKDEYYILDDVNNMYCILYHALIQKNELGLLKYRDFIKNRFGKCDAEYNIKQLAEFMRLNNYLYINPKDKGVFNNKANIDTLVEVLNNGGKNKEHW